MGMEQAGLLPAIPAVIFVVVALFNRFLPRRGDWLVILGMVAVLVLGMLVIHDFQTSFVHGEFQPQGSNVHSFNWIDIGHGLFRIDISTWIDGIAVVMIAVVSIVALMVMVYSVGYMHG